MVWTEKHGMHLLANMHNPPAEGDSCCECGKAMKPKLYRTTTNI